jgi:crossover junction endodeoxyribonuclease RuvC
MKIKLIQHKKPNLNICILGIDASLTHTGLVILNPANELIHAETVSPKTKGTQRLIDYGQYVEDFLYKYEPAIAVMEGYAFTPAVGHAFGLGELGGIIKCELWKHGVPVHIVAPMSLKKFGTGSGKGDKNKIMLSVYRKYGIELKDDDQTDAFILAQIGLRILQQKAGKIPTDVPKYEREVLSVVLKNEAT